MMGDFQQPLTPGSLGWAQPISGTLPQPQKVKLGAQFSPQTGPQHALGR